MTPSENIVPPHQCYCGRDNCVVPYGYCHCLCSEETRISTITHKQHKWIEGQPILYVYGHSKRIRLLPEIAVPFKLEGVYCRLIPLSSGFYTIVDENDYAWLMQWKWYAVIKSHGVYAARGGKQVNGKREAAIYMHRQILGLGTGDPSLTDHKDAWNTLNNSRLNLRPCNNEQNSWNSRRGWLSKTGRKGVYWSQSHQAFIVMIRFNGKKIYIGQFQKFDDACRAREESEKKYHGEFARKD
jgi:hypothetical protein